MCGSVAIGLVSLQAQEPALDELLTRAGAYVVDYQKRLSGVVSEEQYAQLWEKEPGKVAAQRQLRSDVLLTQPPGGKRAILFRDVFEVDGRSVRDREQRLATLFLGTTGSATSQIVRINAESARFNIGDIERTINTPTLALVFLDPQYQKRFSFERTDDRVPESVRGVMADPSTARFVAPPELVVVAYEETDRNTLLSDGNGGILPSRGRFWLDGATGAVVMSELTLSTSTFGALIDVRYAAVSEVNVVVPVAMRERYTRARSRAVITGVAEYSHFRRYQVTSTETLADQRKE